MAMVPAAKRRGSGGAAQRRPLKLAREDTCDGEDLISDLPDAILATIVSLLPTNDGARTQIPDANLQELDIRFSLLGRHDSDKPYPLPSSVSHIASTLLVARIGRCDFPKDFTPPLSFPLLKQLHLRRISISQDVFQEVLSGCHVLEALYLSEMQDVDCLRFSSPTLRIIVTDLVCSRGKIELVIEDAPHLERLLISYLGRKIIRVVNAPKLEILGPLSPSISEIQIASIVFQGMIPAGRLKNPISTVKILSLQFRRPDLNAVLDVLTCFPSLEKLHVIWDTDRKTEMKNVCQCHPLYPITCLDTHLKKMVLKNYQGSEEDIGFAKFFVLNAKVLRGIGFGVCNEIGIDKKWVADQHELLEVKGRASPEAQLKFQGGSFYKYCNTYNLAIADPFDCSFADGVDAL